MNIFEENKLSSVKFNKRLNITPILFKNMYTYTRC